MLDDQDGRREAGWKRGEDLAERLEPTRGRRERDDLPPGPGRGKSEINRLLEG